MTTTYIPASAVWSGSSGKERASIRPAAERYRQESCSCALGEAEEEEAFDLACGSAL
jgi:hypothetical protein